MRFQGAVIKEQGVTFAVVVVRNAVLHSPSRREEVRGHFETQVFRGLPVVLMAQDSRGRATYNGRRDLASFLASLPLSAIPWKEYTARAA